MLSLDKEDESSIDSQDNAGEKAWFMPDEVSKEEQKDLQFEKIVGYQEEVTIK